MSQTSLSVAMFTHPGMVRRRNEDACASDKDSGIVVVCDGVGGAAGGEVASRLAAEAVLRELSDTPNRSQRTPPHDQLLHALETANAEVYQLAQHKPQFHGMATTMVALYRPFPRDEDHTRIEASEPLPVANRSTVWIANVGDSRCYRLRGQHFEQLTWDHSVVEEQVRAGTLTRAQAEISPIRHVITRAIGSQSFVEIDLYKFEERSGDLYLLTTDGLMRELADEEIATILRALPIPPDEARLDSICHQLVETAVAHGGNDNITCALVYIT